MRHWNLQCASPYWTRPLDWPTRPAGQDANASIPLAVVVAVVNILALETSGIAGSVAALADDRLLAEIALPTEKRSAQTLAPTLRQLLHSVGWQPSEVRLVAVSIGPGSFTGLRLGVTTAKVFAYATKADVLGIDTLETIANQAPSGLLHVTALIDAQRGDVVARPFTRNPEGCFVPAGPPRLVSLGRLLEEIPQGTVLTGPVLQRLAGQLPAATRTTEPGCWQPMASTVGRLAARQYAAGLRHDVWTLLPHYARPSAAEEKRGS